MMNWRGLHSALLRALRQRYRLRGYLIYLIFLAQRDGGIFETDRFLGSAGVGRLSFRPPIFCKSPPASMPSPSFLNTYSAFTFRCISSQSVLPGSAG